jgi:hypothetical protein
VVLRQCEPDLFAYFLCGGKESECRPAQGNLRKMIAGHAKPYQQKFLLDMDGCKQNLSICVQDNRRAIFARFSRGPDNGPQTACDFGAFI